jgi:hypothetical protein
MAVSLGEAVEQLRSFQRRYNQAPEIILRLTSELHIFTLFLHNLEPHRQYDRHNATLLDSCAGFCEHDIKRIRELIDKLVAKPNMTNIRFALFQQQELRELVEKLEHSKSTMILAMLTYMVLELDRRKLQSAHGSSLGQQTFTNDSLITLVGSNSSAEQLEGDPIPEYPSAEGPQASEGVVTELVQTVQHHDTRLQDHDTRLVQLESQIRMYSDALVLRSDVNSFCSSTAIHEDDNVPHTAQDDVDSRRASTLLPGNQRRRNRYRLRIRFPQWLTDRIWDLSYVHSQGLWKLQLKTRNMVPHNADIIKYTKEGDLDKIKELVTAGKASLTDYDPGGWDPLIVSTFLSWMCPC